MKTPVTAAVLSEKGGPFIFKQLELDPPRPDEVLVKLVATGICQTDVHVRHQIIKSPLPAVLGHEGAGVVEAVGESVTSVEPGDHVILSYHSCGCCNSCWNGHPAYCTHMWGANFGGARLDGSNGLHDPVAEGAPIHGHFFGQSSFATHALTHHRNTIKVPKDAPLPLLGPLGCSVQTGAGAILKALAVPTGASVVIFGVGAVGLAAVMAARVARAAVIISVDVDADRLTLSRELGATHCIDAKASDNVAGEIKRITKHGAQFVLDTSGRKESLGAGVASLAPMGRFGFVAFGGGSDAVVEAAGIRFGQTLQGIIQGDVISQLFIPELINLHRNGHFPFERLLRFYPFKDINDAFADAEAGTVIKAVLQFNDAKSDGALVGLQRSSC